MNLQTNALRRFSGPCGGCIRQRSVLIFTFLSVVFSSPAALAVSDEERMQEYNACNAAFDRQSAINTLSFLGNAASGNVFGALGAGGAWLNIVITGRNDCEKVLSPAQRSEIARKNPPTESFNSIRDEHLMGKNRKFQAWRSRPSSMGSPPASALPPLKPCMSEKC